MMRTTRILHGEKVSNDINKSFDLNDDLSWEEKDIMGGLGIHDLQHVSSSVSVKEMVTRAAAKVDRQPLTCMLVTRAMFHWLRSWLKALA